MLKKFMNLFKKFMGEVRSFNAIAEDAFVEARNLSEE